MIFFLIISLDFKFLYIYIVYDISLTTLCTLYFIFFLSSDSLIHLQKGSKKILNKILCKILQSI